MRNILVWALWMAIIGTGLEGSELKPISEFQTADCGLRVVEDSKGTRYLIKWILSPDPDEQALLVIDCCAAQMAEELSIPVNQVRLLPPCEEHGLATLHKWAPGRACDEQVPWEGFSLQQRYREPGSLQWQRWGPLDATKCGLSRTVIYHMSRHPDLPVIAALDTFLGNADRSLPNLFYDEETDRFMGIDMAASFRRPLAEIAIERLEELVTEGFSEAELAGLHIYRNTLQRLAEATPPARMEACLQSLGQEAELLDRAGRLQRASRHFEANYKDVLRLISLLDGILKESPSLS